jgi:hypothetical protein
MTIRTAVVPVRSASPSTYGGSRELGSGWHVSWSPAGWLAYERTDGLYVARSASAPERRLVARTLPQPDPSYNDLQPRTYSWSPKGSPLGHAPGRFCGAGALV